MLYSKNGSYPTLLPHRITLSDGTTRTDRSSFTEEEIQDAGYVAVESQPIADYPNKLDWDGIQWIVREPTDFEISERWNYIRKECLRKLSETDYKVIKAVEVGELPPENYVLYRQELRDLYNNVNNVDPWNVIFPTIYSEDVLEDIIEES
jgi:hypothetical protein